jgi:hypothetical protein
MDAASIAEWNTPVLQQKNYLALIRLAMNGNENEYDVWKDLQASTGNAQYVNRGRAISRIAIAPEHQQPVMLDMYAAWVKSSEQVEHFIAYSGYVRKLNAVYGSNSNRASALREVLQKRYGEGTTDYIDSFIAEKANPYAHAQRTWIDKVMRAFRGKTVTAYLALKFSGIVMQGITSPAPYLIYLAPHEYLGGLLKFVMHPRQTFALINDLSVHMENRSADPMYKLVDEQYQATFNKPGHALASINRAGMIGLTLIDRIAVYPGWLALYDKETNRLRKEQPNLTDTKIRYQAVLNADEITRAVQPGSRDTDIAPLFKQKGPNTEILNAFLQFQASLNTVFQTMWYDIPQHIRDRKIERVVGTVMWYALSSFILGWVRHGFDDDDDDADKWRKGFYWMTNQGTDSIPLVGNTVTYLMELIMTGKGTGQSNPYRLLPVQQETADSIAHFARALNASDSKKAERSFGLAAKYGAEAMALGLGLPVSGFKQGYRAFDLDKDDDTNFILELMGRQVK